MISIAYALNIHTNKTMIHTLAFITTNFSICTHDSRLEHLLALTSTWILFISSLHCLSWFQASTLIIFVTLSASILPLLTLSSIICVIPWKARLIFVPVLALVATKGNYFLGDVAGEMARSFLLPISIISTVSLELSWIYESQASMLLRVYWLFRS